jgi:DNA modification methylase
LKKIGTLVMLLLNGDCIEEMQKMIDEGVQVDSVVTDPPYELGFMGKSWDSTGIAFQKETWELAYQLLKPGGHLLAFSSSRTYHRIAVAIEDSGFDIRDQIMWIYGSGFPKSTNMGKAVDKKLGNQREVVGTIERGSVEDAIAKGVGYSADPANQNNKAIFGYGTEILTKGNSEWEGWGTALKPAHEPIVMARKPISEKTVADNVLKHGTGGINIDGCRIKGDTNIKTRVRKAGSEFGQNSGWNDHKNVDTTYDPSKGRFPANVMHDGSEVITKEFPYTKSGMMKQHIEGGQYNVYGKMYPRDVETIGDEGSASRFFYCPKTSKSERNRGLENFTPKPMAWGNQAKAELKRGNLDFVGSGDGTKHNKVAMRVNTHPTVKPQELMKYLCRLVTPKDGTVLDPFMGSGSTGMAAKDEGFDFIGIEREKEYFEIAESRINITAPLSEFF